MSIELSVNTKYCYFNTLKHFNLIVHFNPAYAVFPT